jgi:hypothetical protein
MCLMGVAGVVCFSLGLKRHIDAKSERNGLLAAAVLALLAIAAPF